MYMYVHNEIQSAGSQAPDLSVNCFVEIQGACSQAPALEGIALVTLEALSRCGPLAPWVLGHRSVVWLGESSSPWHMYVI